MTLRHRLPSRTLLCSLVLALAACPADDGTADDGADSGGSGTSTSASATGTTGEPVTSTSEPGTSTTSEPGTDTSDTSAGSGETGPGGLGCGEAICTSSQWCNWSDDACGEGPSGMGSCEPLPEGCDDSYMPVCGCDGTVYSNACSASMMGVDLAADGNCEAPEGYFRCGYSFCSLETEFCQIQVSDIGGYGDSYGCVQPAMECVGGITCDCLTGEPCFDFGCNPTADGGVEIVCPGG